MMPRVTTEWARLREVIVGRPFYRIPRPLSEAVRHRVPADVWRKLKAREGQTLELAMPEEYARCAAQMDAVVRVLEEHGVRVHRVPEFTHDEEGLVTARCADEGATHGDEPCAEESATHGAVPCAESIQFFPRDPLLVVDDLAIELCLQNNQRRRERAPLRRLLHGLGGTVPGSLRRMALPDPLGQEDAAWPCLEGGDCLLLDDEVLVGIGSRGSNTAGADWLQAALGTSRRVTQVTLSAEFGHLDVALGLVRPGLGIVCRDALPDGLPRSVRDWEWIEIGREEALVDMAANVLSLDARHVLLPSAASRVAHELAGRGCEVIQIPFETVTAFKGGLRCWSLPVARWD